MKTIRRAYKTKLDPTMNQRAELEQCGRVARTVFNWVLADYMTDYKAWHTVYQQAKVAGLIPEGKIGNAEWKQIEERCLVAGVDLPSRPFPAGRVVRKKKLNAVKRDSLGLRFILDYPYVVAQEAIDDFDAAMKRYLEKRKSGEVDRKIAERKDNPHYQRRIARMIEWGRVGEQLNPFFPRFKSRFDDPSFRFPRGTYKIEGNRIQIPKIGWVRIAEKGYIPQDPIRFGAATISRKSGCWFVAVAVEEEYHEPDLREVTLGVNVGASDLAATSTGAVYDNPRPLVAFADKKERLQRELSRRSKLGTDGKIIRGKNWRKTKQKLAKIEAKIARVRTHHQHNASKQIVGTLPDQIVLKQTQVQRVMKQTRRQIARRLADAGMGETARQITYKAEWNGTNVRVVESGFNICSQCQSPNIRVDYGRKQMRCDDCGHTMRASVNVAINLSQVEVKK